MLKVKNLTLLSQKIEKSREFWPRLQKKWSSARFFLHPSVAFWLNFNQNFKALALLLIELWSFSPHNLWKSEFFWIFSSKWPPPQEESKCKNAQFLQWILKDDGVYFKKKSKNLKFEEILS